MPEPESEVDVRRPIKEWEFDVYTHVDATGASTVRLSENKHDTQDIVTIKKHGKVFCEIETLRDQWGTWIGLAFYNDSGEVTAAHLMGQEDGTRSFISALISGLSELQQRNEFQTLLPTITEFDAEGKPIEKKNEVE